MWVNLFLCLLVAHLLADFVLQTSKFCKDKREYKWRSGCHYYHAEMVFLLSWLAAWDFDFWWCALTIGVSHLVIDLWKSYCKENVIWFVIDQLLHIMIIAGIAIFWCRYNDWHLPLDIGYGCIAITAAVIICWKPANILIKLILQHHSVNMPKDDDGGFKSGALIGTIERWLILFFVIIQRYDALGFLIAAKSIIRFGEKDKAKTEYVLAGTLLSVFIAVLAGILVSGII